MATKFTPYQIRKAIQMTLQFGYARLDIDESNALIIKGYNNILKFYVAPIQIDTTPITTSFFFSVSIADFAYAEFPTPTDSIATKIKPLVMQALFVVVAYTDLSMYEGKI